MDLIFALKVGPKHWLLGNINIIFVKYFLAEKMALAATRENTVYFRFLV